MLNVAFTLVRAFALGVTRNSTAVDGDLAAVAELAAADSGSLDTAFGGDIAAVDRDGTAVTVAVLSASSDTRAG